MSIVLQRTYSPELLPALEGMPYDQGTGRDDVTRLCETAAGIGFGKAVSFGSSDKGCILAGSAFMGVAMRDITLARAPIDMTADPDSAPLDKYGHYTNVWVRTMGRVWVMAGANVAKGDSLFYNTTNGGFTNSASGQAAAGYLDFVRQPVADETVVIGGVTWTFKDSGASGAESNIGPTLGDTVRLLADGLNASADGTINDATYQAWPPSPGGAGQGSGAYRLLVGFDTVGTGGNSFALDGGTADAVPSASTLLGGTAAATAVTGGKWITSAIDGDLAVINLGIKAA